MHFHHKTFAEDTYFVCFTAAKNIVHFGFIPAGGSLTSRQESCEHFATEQQMAARVDELKGVPGWYESQKPAEPDDTTPPMNVT